jgi:predicted DNA-binding transcriptional regulator AlpA
MLKKTINYPAPTGFDGLSELALVRLPVVQQLYAVSAPTVWRRVKNGDIPAPIRVGLRTTCWKVSDLRAALGAAK